MSAASAEQLPLVPQAAVAAAAGAAGLTAAQLGASPLAVADAVAAAVHHVWRWAGPGARPPGAPVVEADATGDRMDLWLAETNKPEEHSLVGSMGGCYETSVAVHKCRRQLRVQLSEASTVPSVAATDDDVTSTRSEMRSDACGALQVAAHIESCEAQEAAAHTEGSEAFCASAHVEGLEALRHATHVKGFEALHVSAYVEGLEALRAAAHEGSESLHALAQVEGLEALHAAAHVDALVMLHSKAHVEGLEALQAAAHVEGSEALQVEGSEALQDMAHVKGSEALHTSAHVQSVEVLQTAAHVEGLVAFHPAAHVEGLEALQAAAHVEGSEALHASACVEGREAFQDAAHIEASEALPAADQVKRIETLKIELEAAELPRPPEGCRNLSEETLRDERLGDLDLEAAVEPAVDLPVAVDWDNMVARLVVLMNVDMGIGPKVWLPGHDDLHSRTIGLFKEVGELKKGYDAGRIWPSPRLAAMSEECAALESSCVDAQSAGTSSWGDLL